MKSAFIDIGQGKGAFLCVDDIRPGPADIDLEEDFENRDKNI